VPPVVREQKKERKENMKMIKRMITGNEIENRCWDVRSGDI
jgi:preprotein translocase subunit YajC